MSNQMQIAIMKKDVQSTFANKNLFATILILPIIMAIVLPTVFVLIIGLMPLDSAAFKEFATLLPKEMLGEDTRKNIIEALLTNMLPLFFLLIPIISSMVLAASSFVGEKEKRTLETLLYCPLSLSQIFTAKIMGVFVLSQSILLLSFACMTILIQAEIWLITRAFMPMGINWLVMIFLLSPSVSLLAISMIVRTSAKAKSVEEAQQRSVFVILPILILILGQISGAVFVSIWLLLGLSIACAGIGVFALIRSSSKFTSESLLQ